MSTREQAVSVRPVTKRDRKFLARLFASTRAEDPAAEQSSEQQREAFLAQQFHAQSVRYAEQFPDASFDLVLVDGQPAGQLIVARLVGELKLIDISLLPEHRGRGIGTALIRPLLDEASENEARVTIQVERSNRALRLYERLGFVAVENTGAYLKLERPAAAGRATIASS